VEASATQSATADTFPGRLTLCHGRLTAQIKAVPLRQVMAEVGELSGARVVWLQQSGQQNVTVDFRDVPLPRALRLILGQKNFLLFYSAAGRETRLSQIWIASAGEGSGPPDQTTLGSFRDFRTVKWTALHGRDLRARLQAVDHLRRYARTNARAKAMLSQVARFARDARVRRAAAWALARLR
jgi:hypothetical protein